MRAAVRSDTAGIARAVKTLRAGGVVAFPTDTVYGLGCVAEDATARRRFYTAKARPESQPCVLMVDTIEALDTWVVMSRLAHELIGEFWPGPLTLVLPATEIAADRLGEVVRDGTIAVRIPDHPVAIELLRAVALGLATSSANRSGEPTHASGVGVAHALGDDVDVVLDGECLGGVASSILDLTRRRPRVLRVGSIPAERLLAAVGAR